MEAATTEIYTLSLHDAFPISEGAGSAGAGSAEAGKPGLGIDAFDRAYLPWLTMGGVKLKLVGKQNPLGMPAMQAEFAASDGHYGLLLRRVSNLNLKRAT